MLWENTGCMWGIPGEGEHELNMTKRGMLKGKHRWWNGTSHTSEALLVAVLKRFELADLSIKGCWIGRRVT